MAATDKTYIIDASVILAWLLPDELYKTAANKILDFYGEKKIRLTAPTLLPYEVINGLRTAIIRRRIKTSVLPTFIKLYKALEIELINPDELYILQTAVRANISAYDSTYATLANTQNIPFITADRKMISSLRKAGIEKTIWITDVSKIRIYT